MNRIIRRVEIRDALPCRPRPSSFVLDFFIPIFEDEGRRTRSRTNGIDGGSLAPPKLVDGPKAFRFYGKEAVHDLGVERAVPAAIVLHSQLLNRRRFS